MRVILAIIAALLCGCMESNTTRAEQKTITEHWQGSVAVPIPQTTPQGCMWIPTQVPVDLTRTVEESTEGQSQTKTGIDSAAIAQIGAALTSSLKQAFPALGIIGAAGSAPSGGSSWGEILGGGGLAVTAVGTGLAALKRMNSLKAAMDAAWDEASAHKERAARAEGMLAAKSSPTTTTIA